MKTEEKAKVISDKNMKSAQHSKNITSLENKLKDVKGKCLVQEEQIQEFKNQVAQQKQKHTNQLISLLRQSEKSADMKSSISFLQSEMATLRQQMQQLIDNNSTNAKLGDIQLLRLDIQNVRKDVETIKKNSQSNPKPTPTEKGTTENCAGATSNQNEETENDSTPSSTQSKHEIASKQEKKKVFIFGDSVVKCLNETQMSNSKNYSENCTAVRG